MFPFKSCLIVEIHLYLSLFQYLSILIRSQTLSCFIDFSSFFMTFTYLLELPLLIACENKNGSLSILKSNSNYYIYAA